MYRWSAIYVLLLGVAFMPLARRSAQVRVGSKKFTESVLLGEMATQLVRSTGIEAAHFQELGGSQLVFQALLSGDIDIYPEYTGTLLQEILSQRRLESLPELAAALREQGVELTEPLGFNNSYALGVRRDLADQLNLKTISDLKHHPKLRMGYSNEFMERGDGWPALRQRYHLPQTNVTGLDHDLAYRQLGLQAIDVLDVYATDAKIEAFDLMLLEDDLEHFPRYDAVFLYRAELAQRHPKVTAQLRRLENMIDDPQMRMLNAQTELAGESERRVAADFLQQALQVTVQVTEETVIARLTKSTLQHLDLVRRSLIPAILVAIPLGVWAAKQRRVGQVILAVVGIIQTIPALALLVMLMPPVASLGLSSVGMGSAAAVTALFLYSLLPIVRNTYTGLHNIAPQFRDSAIALGLPASFRLTRIELPLASRTILAGIKTAAVLNVGFATLGALIGAGGYGQPILTGIRRSDTGLIMQGAIPAAILALLVQGLFELAERWLVPRGLRLKTHS